LAEHAGGLAETRNSYIFGSESFVESYHFGDMQMVGYVKMCDVERCFEDTKKLDQVRALWLSFSVMVLLKSELPAHKKFKSSIALW
jgi:hypothetical protein